MFCTNCGNRNPEGSNFCGTCGAPLRSDPGEDTTVVTFALETEGEGEEEFSVPMDELEEGTLVQLELGRETSRKRFNPDRRFEDKPLPPVRAPKEAALCLRRLATLVAAAS